MDDLCFEHQSCGVGAVIEISGKKEHRVVDDALKIVERMEHRSGKDSSGEIGDGVGIMTQIPVEFFEKNTDFELGNDRDFGVGMFFMPQNSNKRTRAMKLFELITKEEGAMFAGWRIVPVNVEIICRAEKQNIPYILQGFVKRPPNIESGLEFEKKLYIIRRVFEQNCENCYVASLSSRTIVYKGKFLVHQLRKFYKDLDDKNYKSAMALVHSRFSTNTNPIWERAHPNRIILHNGEINTIRGNVDRMMSRQTSMSSPFLSAYMEKVLPVIDINGSDSSMLDNYVEFLMMNGMDLPLAMMITIPEPWENNKNMKREVKDFYKYYSTMAEPWDGPAAIVFSDGDVVGAMLDRNGLRPVRYTVTKDGYLVLASEDGVLEIKDENVEKKSRLKPGKMLLVDLNKGCIKDNESIKKQYVGAKLYGEWLYKHLLKLKDLPAPVQIPKRFTNPHRNILYKVFGYSLSDLTDIILHMAQYGQEPTGAMGADLPPAYLSKKPHILFDYFKQRFAQVTNPPIDAVRENIVTSTTLYLGTSGNIFQQLGENCRVLEISNPILTNGEIAKIKKLSEPGFKVETISLCYYKGSSLQKAVDKLCFQCDKAYKNGANIIVLSDKETDENHVPIPSLLAVSAVEQHLIKTNIRTKISVVVESGEPRDVHHFALLLGYGAGAINPYLVYEAIDEMIDKGLIKKDYYSAVDDYNKAASAGVVKIASKMGISTLQSYQSAQVFEVLGINKEVVDKYFTNTVSSLGGIDIEDIEWLTEYNHTNAYLAGASVWEEKKINKENYLFKPKTVVALQKAVRNNDYSLFKEYTNLVNNEREIYNLRGVFGFKETQPVPIEEVESVEKIVKRFKTGAVSYGSVSAEAHKCLAKAMNTMGGKSNSGEGGEEPERLLSDLNSKIKQVASGRFGVTAEYLVSAEEIQIKMAQGAKPGEGGHLPGGKVYPWIAKIRYSTPGVALISPPPHHDIYSIEDLAQLIYDLKNINPQADVSVKLVSEAGIGTIASGVAKAGADVILVSGNDGGTGAASVSSIYNAGLPWETGLAETHSTLIENGLRSCVKLETDGKLMSGRDVAIACMLGADEFGFATAPMVAMGCVMLRDCNKDTCPVGVATQNPKLRKRFSGKPEHVINFMTFVACELREIMALLGVRTVDELVGRSDLLEILPGNEKLNAQKILCFKDYKKGNAKTTDVFEFNPENTVDKKVLFRDFEKSLVNKVKCKTEVMLKNTDRAFGTLFGGELVRRFGNGLEAGTFTVKCTGTAGQSFGAFIPKGLDLYMEGAVNDGFGKGLSGGKLVLYPPNKSGLVSENNVIAGNVALYGATSGKAFVSGVAGERFCVRNSGAVAVCEGIGDHGLEYMTGGVVVILGTVGKNFAAGMSGGIAYVYDPGHTLYRKINQKTVCIDTVAANEDVVMLRSLIEEHYAETKSVLAERILNSYSTEINNFKKIVSGEFKKMTKLINEFQRKGMSVQEAEAAAFYENLK